MKVCAVCHKPLKPSAHRHKIYSNKRYCSGACKQRAWRYRHGARAVIRLDREDSPFRAHSRRELALSRGGKSPNGHCVWCGRILQGKHRKYCSASCRQLAYQWRKEHVGDNP